MGEKRSEKEVAWALVLGSSSGFGEACSLELARSGMNIFGVHLDRRATLPHVEDVVREIQSTGRQAVFFNNNAADPEQRKIVLDQMEETFRQTRQPATVRVLLHSLAFGTLKPYLADHFDDSLQPSQVEMTVDVMAHSLVYWVQDLVRRKLMGEGGRIFAMTSSGAARVFPTYGAVSAAKAALESHIRQLAFELAPLGITANAIRAGVTDTPALRRIPGCDKLLEGALRRNPSRRLTTPRDVAAAITVLAQPGAYWMTGNVIGVDGGEDIVG
ncbi:MAG TPA: SDR family oxidoreductase [Candidatus Acidoferrales bacterium]